MVHFYHTSKYQSTLLTLFACSMVHFESFFRSFFTSGTIHTSSRPMRFHDPSPPALFIAFLLLLDG